MRPLDCRRPDHRMWQFSLQQEIAMIANLMSAHRRLSATFFTPLLLVALGSVPSAAQTVGNADADAAVAQSSEEHTSELQSLMRISYAVFCLKKKHNIRYLMDYTCYVYTHVHT